MAPRRGLHHRRVSSGSNTDVAAAVLHGGVRHGPRWTGLIVATLAALLAAAYFLSAVTPGPAPFVVSGYVPEYRLNHVQDHLATLARSVNELVLFSVQPTSKGEIRFDVGLQREQLKLAAAAHAQGIPSVLVSMGGAGRSAHFAAVLQDKGKRKRMIQQLLTLCEEYSLNGVDLDWEGPAGSADMESYVVLMQELKHVFSQHNLLVTAAIHHWQNFGRRAYQLHLDALRVMAYDLPGQHSTLEHAKKIVKHFLTLGVPPNKLMLGIPAYGRGVRASNDVRTYSEILAAASGHLAPDVDTTEDNLYFNGVETVGAKASWALAQGLRGVFFWQLGQDALDPTYSLAAAAYNASRPN